MTGEQARQVLAAGRARIEAWKQKLLPIAGAGTQVEGTRVSLDPRGTAEPEPVRTLMLHVWAVITMNQTMTEVVTLPPTYDENASYEYPPFLVAAISYTQATGGYEWPQVPQILPAAGVAANEAGELLQGGLWQGLFVEGTAPSYDIEVDLDKTALVTLYLRGRYIDATYQQDYNDPAKFDTDLNVGTRTLSLRLEGNRPAPLPNEEDEFDKQVGYTGNVFSLQPLPRGDYPDTGLTSVFSLTAISGN
jgi:hypothetical protein